MTSIRSFVSHVSAPQLLQQFLATHSIALTVDVLSGPAKSAAEVIDEQLHLLAPGSRARLMQQIESIEKMSTEAGQTAIDSIALDDEIAALPSKQARAMWLLLHDADRFRRAADVVYTDAHRYTRQWNTFVGPARATLKLDPESSGKVQGCPSSDLRDREHTRRCLRAYSSSILRKPYGRGHRGRGDDADAVHDLS